MPNWKKVIVSGSSAELTTLKTTGLSAQNSEATSLMINTSGVVGTRELGSNAFNSTAFTTNTGTMSSWIIKEGNGTETATVTNGETVTIEDGTGIQSELTSTSSGGTITITNTSPNVVQTTITGNAGTATLAANSTLAGGLAIGTGRNNTANQIVRTNSSGYAEIGWINTTSGNTTGTITDIYVNTNDGYIRKATKSHLLSQLGIASGATNVTNNNQIDNGAGYTTNVGDITGVTAGGGLSGGGSSGGVTISHSDTSSQSSVNGSGRTYIQDITLDTYGHVTGLATATETVTNTNTVRGVRTTNGDVGTALESSETLNITAGNNVSISESAGVVTIASTDTNTTYSVGAGGLTQQNFTTTLKNKLDGIAASATNVTNNSQISNGRGYITSYTDTNTFRGVRTTNGDTATSLTAEETLNLTAGTNVSISESGGVVTISSTDTNTTYSVGAGGLTQQNFTTTLKNKLDGITASANNYTLPLSAAGTRGGVKIGYSENGKNYPVELSSEKMYVNVPWTDNNTTYSVGAGGLTQQNFTTTLKNKLDGIATGATNVTNNSQISNGRGYITSYTDTNTFRGVRTTSGDVGTTLTDEETLNLTAGTNVSISESAGVVTISSTDTNTTYSVGAGGLTQQNFTTTLKNKLDGIAASATNVTNNNQITNGRGFITSYTDTNTVTSVRANSGEYRTGNLSLTEGSNITVRESSTGVFQIDATDTNTTYSADGNYGMTLSGTAFRLEDDRRRNSTSVDIRTGNTHDYTFYDASHGIWWYTAGSQDMYLTNAGTLHVDGDVVAYSTSVSDERLKDNVTTIENPLDKIKALRGVEYDWNSGSRKGKHDLGLIAQEVEKVIPNIVHEHEQPFLNDDEEDETLYKTVDYEKLTAVLIEGMKEQQIQIDSMKSEINELKGRL